MKNETIYSICIGFFIGVFFMFAIFGGSESIRLGQLKNELIESQGLVAELRAENASLIVGQSEITGKLDEAIDRNRELTQSIGRAGIEIERAVSEATELGELIDRIIQAVDQLYSE